ncbi:MAG: hypothetical protein AAF215_02325 [Cyanobacteria bacterium P01_A01_bin.123]
MIDKSSHLSRKVWKDHRRLLTVALYLLASVGLHSVMLRLPMLSLSQSEDIRQDLSIIDEASDNFFDVVELPSAQLPETAPPGDPIPPPSNPTPQQQPPPNPATPPTLTPETQLTPNTTSDPDSENPRSATTGSETNETPDPLPYANFTHPTGATAGCQGNEDCWEMPGNWRSNAPLLEAQIEAEGYEFRDLTDDLAETPGVQIYAAYKDDQPQYYISIVSVLGGTRYVFSDQSMTTEELSALQGP